MRFPSHSMSATWAGLRTALGIFALLAMAYGSLARADTLPYGQGLLWKVEPPGGEASYVFGTMHLTDARVVATPQPVVDALAASKEAAFEVVFDEQSMMKTMAAMFLTDGRTLQGIIGPEMFQVAVQVAAAYGMPAEGVNFFKPWALTVTFSMTPDEIQAVGTGAPPLDMLLQRQAAELGKPLHGLETAGEQLDVFDRMPESQQLALLEVTLAHHAELEDYTEAMIEDYLARDLDGIVALAYEQMNGLDAALIEGFFTRMVDVRNERMVERMTGLLASGSTFVAVGALHLPGEGGILRLLEQRGYRLTRVY
jgi:uncharacterized protein YbaP (TraB family)